MNQKPSQPLSKEPEQAPQDSQNPPPESEAAKAGSVENAKREAERDWEDSAKEDGS